MTAASAAFAADVDARPVGVVICGTFRRGLDELRADRSELLLGGCRVLSPIDTNFVREDDGFVFARHEEHFSPSSIEERHLAALRMADFVWLHVPDGYLGPSGAFELGVAAASGVPVFARHQLKDVGLLSRVQRVRSPSDAVAAVRERLVADPGAGVRPLQTYYARAAADRGWTSETPAETLALLAGEVEELSEALEKHADAGGTEEVAFELADVQLYVVHMANALGIDLAAAVTSKEAINAARFGPRSARTA